MPKEKQSDDEIINNLEILLNLETLEESDLWDEMVKNDVFSEKSQTKSKKNGGKYE